VQGLLDAALANPWATLDRLVDGPLHPGGEAATADLLDRADVGAGTRLLDVGCGAGRAVSLAADRDAVAMGVDRDPDRADGRAVRGDATGLPVADDAVDVVLSECVLCLTDLDRSLAETERVLAPGGRLALSDVVVGEDAPEIPDRLARALCLTGARSRADLCEHLVDAGFSVEDVRDHREDLLALSDDVGVDYEGLLGAMGERGRRARDALADLETAVEDGRVSYVSVISTV